MTAVSDFQTYVAAAQTAFAADDFDTARKQLILARMSLAMIPDSASDGTSVNWRQDLDALEKSITAEAGRTAPSATAFAEFTAE